MTRVSNKTLSLRQIIDRDLTGILSPASEAIPWYNEDQTIPDFKRMDLVDRDNYRSSLEQQRVELEETARNEKKEAARKRNEAKRARQEAAKKDGPNETNEPSRTDGGK